MVNSHSTLPKPFVFVLMPFVKEFDDIYKFGIKGAAEDVGAYAERLDEQLFVEGMLDRIFNQISKSDVVIADMTGRNPNVFYEVGYAHALGKIVLLITKDTKDIPFDLKHRKHIVYSGSIDTLRCELGESLKWAINESKSQGNRKSSECISLQIFGIDIPTTATSKDFPIIDVKVQTRSFALPLQIRNDSYDELSSITHIYLFVEDSATLVPCKYEQQQNFFTGISLSVPYPLNQTFLPSIPVAIDSIIAADVDSTDGLVRQFRLPKKFSSLPPSAVEVSSIDFLFAPNSSFSEASYRLRIHTRTQFHDYSFKIKAKLQETQQLESTPKSEALDKPIDDLTVGTEKDRDLEVDDDGKDGS